MKMLKATWMAVEPQWYFWSIGLTNNVQPYCRLAIITMQMMPKTSCPQRVPSDAVTCSVRMFEDASAIRGFPPDVFYRRWPGPRWPRARAKVGSAPPVLAYYKVFHAAQAWADRSE